MDDLTQSLASFIAKAYKLDVEEGRRNSEVEHKMIGRKQFDEEFGIKVDAFDKHYRSKKSFPSPEDDGKWYAPVVHLWLLNHQQHNN